MVYELFVAHNNDVILRRKYNDKDVAMEMLSFFRIFFPETYAMQIFVDEPDDQRTSEPIDQRTC